MLENIGFYTLSDKRAKNASFSSDLMRCELILTDRCNFNCIYCRGLKSHLKGDMSYKEAVRVVDMWAVANIHNVRFSGGEPTIWPGLLDLVKYTSSLSTIEHIALSTNGSASFDEYIALAEAGINDFSISLDACCASTADKMAGVDSRFNHISEVIRLLSKKTYVTVGVVLNENNIEELKNIIQYATSLGVSDIRIIPSAQWDNKLKVNVDTEYKILSYRINNINNGKHVRSISKNDCHKCHLCKDDMVVVGDEHYPCIIYMREQGEAIGKTTSIEKIREERKEWFLRHNSYEDNICRKNCLDVCVDYNNKAEE